MEQLFVCDRCGSPCTIGLRFCTVCGRSLTYRCPRCSAVVDPEFKFCTGCGAELAWKPVDKVEKPGKLEYISGQPSSVEEVISYITDREVRRLAASFMKWVKSWKDEHVRLEPIENYINLKAVDTIFSQLQPRRKSFTISYYSSRGKLKNYKVITRDSLAAAKKLVKKSYQYRIKHQSGN